MNYFVKDYGFTNNKAETLTDQSVQTNVIRSVLTGKHPAEL